MIQNSWAAPASVHKFDDLQLQSPTAHDHDAHARALQNMTKRMRSEIMIKSTFKLTVVVDQKKASLLDFSTDKVAKVKNVVGNSDQ